MRLGLIWTYCRHNTCKNMGENLVKTNIVVVCWNALEYTKTTIDSLFKTVKHPFYLTIIDNSSTDGTVKYLEKLKVPQNCVGFHLTLNKDNVGYGGAVNQGYEISKQLGAEYTCICNNDLLFENGWLTHLEKVLISDENIGILSTMRPSVHITHPYYELTAKEVVDSTPAEYSVSEEIDYFTKGRTWIEFLEDLKKINDTRLITLKCPPEVAVTFCALVNNRAIEKIGHLADPQFEKYGSEDADLSWSLNKAGYKCCIDNRIYTHHFRHKSITASNLDRAKYLKMNNRLFFKKWSNEIYSFLSRYTNDELRQKFNEENDNDFWFLRFLNNNIQFWNGEKVMVTKR